MYKERVWFLKPAKLTIINPSLFKDNTEGMGNPRLLLYQVSSKVSNRAHESGSDKAPLSSMTYCLHRLDCILFVITFVVDSRGMKSVHFGKF